MFLGLLAGGLVMLAAVMLFGIIVASLTFIYVGLPAALILGFLGLLIKEQFEPELTALRRRAKLL